MLGMFIIWKLKRLSVKLRAERGLPPIEDPDDLPDPKLIPDYEFVSGTGQDTLIQCSPGRLIGPHREATSTTFLSAREVLPVTGESTLLQVLIEQTWYKPHATATHRAFPITWALWNTVVCFP